jgi:hypothetical protein
MARSRRVMVRTNTLTIGLAKYKVVLYIVLECHRQL